MDLPLCGTPGWAVSLVQRGEDAKTAREHIAPEHGASRGLKEESDELQHLRPGLRHPGNSSERPTAGLREVATAAEHTTVRTRATKTAQHAAEVIHEDAQTDPPPNCA
jgi:hypothetical protein